jgi:hypothetical protein
VQVEDHQRRELDQQPGLRLRLGRVQQQVVAVDVAAIGGAALEARRTVRVGARQQDDVDTLEDALEPAGSQVLGDDREAPPCPPARRRAGRRR